MKKAGHLADVHSKRQVLIATKMLEIVTMVLGFVAFLSGQFSFMLAVLFLLALQSTFFSPAKYGILPELVEIKDLSRANGWLEMSSFLAIILGTSLGSVLFAVWKDRLPYENRADEREHPAAVVGIRGGAHREHRDDNLKEIIVKGAEKLGPEKADG